jgi:hypothetical protein
MLRICYADSIAVQKWTLSGQLAGRWVSEFRDCWRGHRSAAPNTRAVADLSEVTFIDESGEELLAEMLAAGVEFITAGVETRHVIENLRDKSEKPLRRLIRND